MPTTDHRTRAASELDRDLAVTAGAGAGKTTVLVDRFVAIATNPAVGPEHILAITFTRKAAVEMKERVIRELEKRGEVALRRATEGAYISTIHGFAERILRERPFDARIDPAFNVITDYDKELWIEEALQEMYGRKDLRDFAPRLKKSFEGGWRLSVVALDGRRVSRVGLHQAETSDETSPDHVFAHQRVPGAMTRTSEPTRIAKLAPAAAYRSARRSLPTS